MKDLNDSTMGSTMDKIPKTLILVPVLHLTGGVGNYYSLLNLNSDSQIDYFVINKGVPQSPVGTIIRLIRNYAVFFLKMSNRNYSVVMVNPSLDNRSYFRDSVFILLARLCGKKIIIFFRGWLESFEEQIKKGGFKSRLFKISYAKADKYVVLGEIFKEKLISMGVPEGSRFVIETTVADSSFLEELDLNRKFLAYQEEIKILFLARMVKEKGIYIAIDAFREFLDKKQPERDAQLIIAGDGPELAAVRQYVAAKKIQKVHFLGNVSGEAKMKLLIDSHILLFPSHTEGLPNSVLEAMLFGMPIITRATGGIPEIIKNGVNGYLTESFDPSVFSSFLLHLSSDNELYKNMAVMNHQTAMEKFTHQKVKKRMLQILGSIKGGTSLAPNNLH